MIILDGRKVRDAHAARLVERVRALSCQPTLALFQVGDNRESNVYIAQKKKFAESIGARVIHRRFAEDASFSVLADAVRMDNADDSIHGIIVQLPLPPHVNKDDLIDVIDPLKDVDGLTTENQRLLAEGNPGLVPATARAVMFILDFYGIDMRGRQVAVLGRSRLVGSPVARLLSLRGAEVSVCHSKTLNTREITSSADIVVVAIGKPEFIGADYFKAGATVVDVGINSVAGQAFENEVPKRRLVGDVDHRAVEGLVSAITPVPGGVGPVTVLSLFDTLVGSAEKSCRMDS